MKIPFAKFKPKFETSSSS